MSKRKTNKQFIEEVQGIFGDKYDCSYVKYVNALVKVKSKEIYE